MKHSDFYQQASKATSITIHEAKRLLLQSMKRSDFYHTTSEATSITTYEAKRTNNLSMKRSDQTNNQ